ncbi:MAG: ion channel [Candidatus Dormibacteria bacterium]
MEPVRRWRCGHSHAQCDLGTLTVGTCYAIVDSHRPDGLRATPPDRSPGVNAAVSPAVETATPRPLPSARRRFRTLRRLCRSGQSGAAPTTLWDGCCSPRVSWWRLRREFKSEWRATRWGLVSTASDGLWWEESTTTTVGYGDRFPVTFLGPVVGVVLVVGRRATFGSSPLRSRPTSLGASRSQNGRRSVIY